MTAPVGLDPGAWPVGEAIDNAAKPYPGWLKALRYALIGLRLTVAWRWLLAALAVPLIISLVVLPFGGQVVVLTGPAVAGVGLWRSPFFRARWQQAVTDSQEIIWRRVLWPLLCSARGMVEIANRRVRVAKLIRIEFGPSERLPIASWVPARIAKRINVPVPWRPSWMKFTVKPLAKHPLSVWDFYEYQIRAFVEHRSSSWTPNPGNPNHLIVTTRRRAAPEKLVLGTDVEVSVLDPPDRSVPSLYRQPEPVFLGVGADEDPITWNPDDSGRSSLFITGRMGSGKGVILKLITVFGARAGWRIQICNPKQVGEFHWLGEHVSEASTAEGMFTMIHAFRTEMERRAKVIKNVFGVASWAEIPIADLENYDMAHRELLVIDELVTLMSLKVGGNRPGDPYPTMVGDVQAIASMGRAMGMSLICMTQHPIAETMGPSGIGSTIKANLGGRIGVGYLEPEGAGSLFGKGNGETIAALLRGGKPGLCVVQGLTGSAADGRWRLGQIVYGGDHNELLAPLLPPEPAHLPVEYDEPDDNEAETAA